MSLTPGKALGPYEIVDVIGIGEMGEVYKARDTRLNRTAAVKVLPEHVASDPERKQRFVREAPAIAALNHPHICVVHDVGEDGGTQYLVMEYLEGETLGARLEKGALPLDQALKCASHFEQLAAKFEQCRTLVVGHEAKVPDADKALREHVHQKPANKLFGGNGHGALHVSVGIVPPAERLRWTAFCVYNDLRR